MNDPVQSRRREKTKIIEFVTFILTAELLFTTAVQLWRPRAHKECCRCKVMLWR